MSVFYQTTLKPVTLEYEKRIKRDEDFEQIFSDMGFVIRGRTDEGEDICLWTFLYIQRGKEALVDGDVNQTLFIATKYSDEEKHNMHDTPYINKGQNIEDYADPGEIKIDESDPKKVVWSGHGRVYTCTPPAWHVSGTHAGVEMDVKFTSMVPGFFHGGEFEKLPADKGSAGYINHCRCSGTITTNKKTYRFKGFGVHERMLNPGIVHDRTVYMSGRGLNWIHSWSDSLSFFCFRGDVGAVTFCGMLYVDGETFPLLQDDGGIEESEYWLDPKSKIMTPRRWKIWIKSPRGKLESEVVAYGRGYYTWIRRHGQMVVNQLQADARTTFTYNDGRKIELEQVSFVEHMRTLYRQSEE